MARRKKNAAPRRFTNADKALFRKLYESTVFMGGPRRDTMIPKYGGRLDINYVKGVRVRPQDFDEIKRMVDRGIMFFTQVSERDGYPPMPMSFMPTKKTVSGRGALKVYAMISDVYLDHPHWLLPGYYPMPMQGRQMPAPARGGTDDGTGNIKSGYAIKPGISPKAKALIQSALKTRRRPKRAAGAGHGIERKGKREKAYVGEYDPVTGKIINPSQMSHAERADLRMQQAREHLETSVVLFEQGKWMDAYNYALNAQGEAWRATSDIEDGGDILQRVQGTAEMMRLIGAAKTLQEQVIRLHEMGADLPKRKPNPSRAAVGAAGEVAGDLLVGALLNPQQSKSWRITRNLPYREGTPGHTNIRARQGHYLRAPNLLDALREVSIDFDARDRRAGFVGHDGDSDYVWAYRVVSGREEVRPGELDSSGVVRWISAWQPVDYYFGTRPKKKRSMQRRKQPKKNPHSVISKYLKGI